MADSYQQPHGDTDSQGPAKDLSPLPDQQDDGSVNRLKGNISRIDTEKMHSLKINNVWDAEKEDIFKLFEKYPVADVHIPWRKGEFRQDGKPKLKGYAFVRFDEESVARKALEEMKDSNLMGRPVGLHWVDPQPPKFQYGGGPRRYNGPGGGPNRGYRTSEHRGGGGGRFKPYDRPPRDFEKRPSRDDDRRPPRSYGERPRDIPPREPRSYQPREGGYSPAPYDRAQRAPRYGNEDHYSKRSDRYPPYGVEKRSYRDGPPMIPESRYSAEPKSYGRYDGGYDAAPRDFVPRDRRGGPEPAGAHYPEPKTSRFHGNRQFDDRNNYGRERERGRDFRPRGGYHNNSYSGVNNNPRPSNGASGGYGNPPAERNDPPQRY